MLFTDYIYVLLWKLKLSSATINSIDIKPVKEKKKRKEEYIMRVLYLVLGFIFLGIGAVGAVLPLLPSAVFLLAATYFFAKSSKRLHDWFLSTDLYKKNLESYVKNRAMTVKTKLTIICSITLTMAIGFIMMSRVPIGRIILAIVWVCHILYFVFGIKTIQNGGKTI